VLAQVAGQADGVIGGERRECSHIALAAGDRYRVRNWVAS
jgi:hypothetical protein